jgi:hypothetical protein
MIYYLPSAADHRPPSGGTKTHVRHVRLLDEMGWSARLLHVTPGFRYPWISHDYPVAYLDGVALRAGDVLVTNEIMGPNTAEIAPPGVRTIVFNQNSHYTFRGYSVPPPPDCATPYRDPRVVGTMVLTDYCRDALRAVFPDHPVHVVPHGIDPLTFPLGTAKRRQIAWMPRKHPDEAQQVFGWLRFSGALDGWDVVAIDGQSEAETSRILQESLVFFAFGYPEGGTLPPFEAGACGCYVLGYGGHSSDMLMRRCGMDVVLSSDTTDFTAQAQRLLRRPVVEIAEEGRVMSRGVQEVLPLEGERAALKAAMGALL